MVTRRIKCPKCENNEAEIFDILGATCVRCFKCGYDNSDVYDVIDTEKRTGGGKSSPYKRGGGKRSQNIVKKY